MTNPKTPAEIAAGLSETQQVAIMFAFRLGDGDVKNHTLTRLDRLFGAAIGQRLTYKELIA